MAILLKVDNIIKLLEPILRGGVLTAGSGLTLDGLLKESHDIFTWFQSAYDNGESVLTNCNQSSNAENDSDGMKFAIKLHNKVKNLSSSCYLELRNVLKATSGLMLIFYGLKSLKVVSPAVKILSSAGKDLQRCPNATTISLQCLSSAVQIWAGTNSIMMEQLLSPLEFQDMKILVCQAYLDKAEMLNKLKFKQEDIRKTLSGAMEIVQCLPCTLKISCASVALRLGHAAAENSSSIADAIHYFKLVLNTIDGATIPIPSIRNTDREDEGSKVRSDAAIFEMKIKAQLSLAYCYKEIDQCDKAISCIHAIEEIISNAHPASQSSILETLLPTILYAKFAIVLKDEDFIEAELALRALLKASKTPFETALSAVKSFVDDTWKCAKTSSGHSKLEFYKLLSFKFPSDPEFTSIRISHLQSILANVRTTDEEGKDLNAKALSISKSIIADHSNATRILSSDYYKVIKSIITERIRWHRNMSQWEFVVDWCDALAALIANENDSEAESRVALCLLKSDSYLYLRRFEDALQVSEELVKSFKSSRTMAMLFKSMLHARQPVDLAVKRLIALLSDMRGTSISENHSEVLSRLIFCSNIAQRSNMISLSDRDRATRLLLKEWLHFYSSQQVWKQKTVADSNLCDLIDRDRDAFRDDCNIAYFEVARDAAQIFLTHNFQHLNLMPSSEALPAVEELNTSANTSVPMEVVIPQNEIVDDKEVDMVVDDAVGDDSACAKCPVEESANIDEIKVEDQQQVSNSSESGVNVLDGQQSAVGSEVQIEESIKESECVKCDVGEVVNKYIRPTSPLISTEKSDYYFPETTSCSGLLKTGKDEIEAYKFNCTLADMNDDVLSLLEDVGDTITAVNSYQEVPLTANVLGEMKTLEWMANLAWNLGKVLMTQKTTFHSNRSTNPQPSLSTMYTAAACYFEIAEEMYASIPLEIDEGRDTTRCLCLMISSAARLDVENMHDDKENNVDVGQSDVAQFPQSHRRERDTSESSLSGLRKRARSNENGPSKSSMITPSTLLDSCTSNLRKALSDVLKAVTILNQYSDFEDESTRYIRKNLVLIQFACLCKIMDIKGCQQFVRDQEAVFLSMTGEELSRCADIARFEAGGSLDISRSMLLYALQVSARSSTELPSARNSFMTQMYCKLIELSPSRETALEKVEEFEQWASAQQQPEGSHRLRNKPELHQDCVDRIVSLAYNYGVTLVDLDQVALAEKFVSKAISLLRFASDSLQSWLPRMQETYAYVQKEKSERSLRFECPTMEPTKQSHGNEIENNSSSKDGNNAGRVREVVLSHENFR